MSSKNSPKRNNYEVIIIGGGVVGAAALYTLSKYTNVKRIALIEKCKKPGQVNSHYTNNSQTLHFGDIETNYTLEKAKSVNESATLVKNYVDKYDKRKKLHNITHKMVLAVGKEQVKRLRKRCIEFRKLFPKTKMLEREELAKVEPMVVKGRNESEEILAMYSEDGYAVDYGLLSESFVKEAKKRKGIDAYLETKVEKIEKEGNYKITTDKGEFSAKAILVCAGAHSLIFAKSLGYATHFGLLSVAGNFFCTGERVLKGKVYTMQIEKLPFAAVHGDPNIRKPKEIQFGPTAKVLPMLERNNYSTIVDFLKTSALSIAGVMSLLKIISDPIIFNYILKNIVYDLPFIGKRAFMKEVRKIVPTLRLNQLEYSHDGGIRPQIVDTKRRALEMGNAKFKGDNIIFNVTPSPGASVCLQNAEKDVNDVIKFLNRRYKFDQKKFRRHLLKGKG